MITSHQTLHKNKKLRSHANSKLPDFLKRYFTLLWVFKYMKEILQHMFDCISLVLFRRFNFVTLMHFIYILHFWKLKLHYFNQMGRNFYFKKKSLAKDQYIFNFKSFTSIFAGLVCFAYFQSSFFNTCMHIPINRNKINFW